MSWTSDAAHRVISAHHASTRAAPTPAAPLSSTMSDGDDAHDNRTSVADPHGLVTSYVYDGLDNDPIGPEGGLNTHTYVNGDPIGLADPTGLMPALPPPAASPDSPVKQCGGNPIGLLLAAFLAARQAITFAWLSACPVQASQLHTLEIKFWSYGALAVALVTIDLGLLVRSIWKRKKKGGNMPAQNRQSDLP